MEHIPLHTGREDHLFTAVITQDGPWWIGWFEEVPGVNCQEECYEELLISLRETLTEAHSITRT